MGRCQESFSRETTTTRLWKGDQEPRDNGNGDRQTTSSSRTVRMPMCGAGMNPKPGDISVVEVAYSWGQRGLGQSRLPGTARIVQLASGKTPTSSPSVPKRKGASIIEVWHSPKNYKQTCKTPEAKSFCANHFHRLAMRLVDFFFFATFSIRLSQTSQPARHKRAPIEKECNMGAS